MSTSFTEQMLAAAEDLEANDVDSEGRERARQRLESVGIPGTKDEEWRFVNLRPLTNTDFVPAASIDAEVTEAMVASWAVPESDGTRLVFVNGSYAPELSSTDGFPEGVAFGQFSQVGDEERETIAEQFGQPAEQFEEDYFANLNAAGFTDGGYVVVPPDTAVDSAIQLLHISTESATPYVSHPRHLVVIGDRSKASIIEDYAGPAGGTYFTNGLTEVSVGESATVNHVKVQGESTDAFHVHRTAIDLEDSSTYNSQTVAYGAKFSRFDIRANGDGQQIDCTLDGLAVLDGKQESDTHSVMDHRQPNAGSHQLHKMILDDKAHAVFNGKIFVQQEAQKIDAYQLNRSLLLSKSAKVNTKPQLEIFADDVSCTHGATIGQLEDEQMFYLRSRGLDEQQARRTLIYAFAAEILETIPVESIQERVAETIARKTRKGYGE